MPGAGAWGWFWPSIPSREEICPNAWLRMLLLGLYIECVLCVNVYVSVVCLSLWYMCMFVCIHVCTLLRRSWAPTSKQFSANHTSQWFHARARDCGAGQILWNWGSLGHPGSSRASRTAPLMLRIPRDAVEPTQLNTCLSGSLTAVISPGSF